MILNLLELQESFLKAIRIQIGNIGNPASHFLYLKANLNVIYPINKVEENVVFLTKKCLIPTIPTLFFLSRNVQVTLVKKPQLKIISFQIVNLNISFIP